MCSWRKLSNWTRRMYQFRMCMRISLSNSSSNETNQIYCNYRLINRYFPLILEFIAPSVGLLYMGRINHGLFKLFCVFIIVLRNGKILGENFFTALISTIFFFLYVIDLFCILFLIYTDGNGMPLY